MPEDSLATPKTPLEDADKITQEPVEKSVKKVKKTSNDSKRTSKIMVGFGLCGLAGGIACACVGIFTPKEILPDLTFPKIPTTTSEKGIYSDLTGQPLATAEQKTAPAFCVQTPNGTDGARPQAGLNQAGVVFEAIAESGITRFAAIYQDPTSAVIGPIRSLRLYYLQWDAPFDCTIVHAGGAPDALEAVRSYKDLTEDYAYMYRGTTGTRLWNNLFTTASYLKKMASDRGYNESNIKGFARMTPTESTIARVNAGTKGRLDIAAPAEGDTSAITPAVSDIAVNFGGWATFNVRYHYDSESNSYLRSYETGDPHNVYICPDDNLGEVNPETSCQLGQLSPSVVVVMKVTEKRASDNYHEDITTTGTGEAYVFQNGQAVKGTWQKATVADQIRFFDESGAEIRLAPGQTWVEAVPNYGSIDF